MAVIDVPLIGKPKQVILDMAFEDCGLAGYDFDRTPGEISAGLRRLNALMLEWPWNLLGYVQPPYGEGAPEELSNIPDFALNTVAQYLALRIAPQMGASLSPEQRAAMSRSLMTLQGELATIPDVQMPAGTPLGAGNGRRYPFSIAES
jgi:hypothetical protein